MSIFSRVKKAKKAAAEHKKAVEVQAGEVNPPPPPYKHVPTHAALDALAATPMMYSPEENRARIAAARKTYSERSASASVTTVSSAQRTYAHPRANNEVKRATHPAYRPWKDLSIGSVIQQPQVHIQQSKLSTQNSLSTMSHETNYSQLPSDFQAFGQPRDAPAPPRGPKAYRASHAASGSLSETRRKSPLSTVSTEESRCCGIPPYKPTLTLLQFPTIITLTGRRTQRVLRRRHTNVCHHLLANSQLSSHTHDRSRESNRAKRKQ
jgi:hypothetical protein